MQAIIDTNVWATAFLAPTGTPAQLLREVKLGRLTLLYSHQIEAEYRVVLARPKLNINPELLADFFLRLQEDGLRITPNTALLIKLPDPDDARFIAAALSSACPIVTGNARHFSNGCGVDILSPAQWLARLMG
jgi:putative PIN family toxin of toxin-antitoxin system